MTTKCFKCRNEISVPDWIQEGQHVQCPYCNCKFQWQTRSSAKPSSLIKPRRKKILMMLVIGFSILIVVTLWFTRDRIQYCMTKKWYATQLKQGGLCELSFDYDQMNNAGSLILSGGTSLLSISWTPYHIDYPRSMSKDFARQIINARKNIERYESVRRRLEYNPRFNPSFTEVYIDSAGRSVRHSNRQPTPPTSSSR